MKITARSFIPRKNQFISICTLAFLTTFLNNSLLGNRAYSPADSLNAVHYEIHINNINFQTQSINSSTTVTLTPLSDPIQMINLELIALTVTNVWVDGTQVLDFTQSDSLLSIPLVSKLYMGDTIKVVVDYNGAPFHEGWGGFHFFGEYAFNLGVGISTIPHNLGKSWYPCVDNFTDRATYDVFCTLPEGKIAIGGGLLMEVIDNNDDTKTYHWNLRQPIPTYLSSIAIGNYVAVIDTFSGINGQLPINIYVKPQDTTKVVGTFINLKKILTLYEKCMGPYPWDRVGFISTTLGSMEHASNIFVDYETISGSINWQFIIAHELAHMWMGDKVTCSSAEDMWINEGWATFFHVYYALALYGDEEAYKLEMRNKHSLYLQTAHTNDLYFPMNQIPQKYTYTEWTSYNHGATTAQALRFYLGDSLFFETLKAFIDEFAFNHASSYDMRDLMSSYTGLDMNGFFNNYVLKSGTPHYSIDSFNVIMKEVEKFETTVYVKQKRNGPEYIGDGNIMEVTFMDDKWNHYTDTIHFDGQTGSSIKTLTFRPTIILVDLDEKMCDATIDNYKKVIKTGNIVFGSTFFSMDVKSIVDSAFIQATHNWAQPDSLKTPIERLRLSDCRYWRIDGIIPAGMQATGKFSYNNLDNTLITSSTDNVIILYRQGAFDDWHEVDFEKNGTWKSGNILVNNLKPGEYVLAVREPGVGIYDLNLPKINTLEIFPNPSSETFKITISSNSQGELIIYRVDGQLVKSFPIYAGNSQITWTPKRIVAGTYYVALVQKEKGEVAIKKVIYLP